ncbi:hypothetical protein Ae201684P_018454 [Aphanomyces euteiches]|uniref:DDE Tnp4 domain-containing protein n=1 Tax=Aphanomyces euteiches TaxID=100861 RepID=A0A6G0XV28_9STRA|nr:hypothetical protein Ae201684_000796 [Aphanomyces euteiches]KAH9099439.1 hypothetical protein Ae201684P_018454 [Aphanomyces euteiches]
MVRLIVLMNPSMPSRVRRDIQRLLHMRFILSCARYMYERSTLTKYLEHLSVLPLLPVNDFVQEVRVSQTTFAYILRIIETSPVFVSAGNRNQRPVWVQLAVALHRIGHNGTGASLGMIARAKGIGFGTVREKPSLYGEVYFSRKKEYSMNVMLTVDPSRQIRHVIVGWPGSVRDSTVRSSGDPYVHPRFYFDPKQYLIGDSGFALSLRMLTPYRLPSSLDPENEIMNNQLSGLRVACEHTNGILKGRWCSLTELPVDIRKVDDIKLVCDWILAACVLHNIVNRLRNNRDDVPVYVEKNRKINKPDASNVEGTQEAREWRESIKREVLKFCGV